MGMIGKKIQTWSWIWRMLLSKRSIQGPAKGVAKRTHSIRINAEDSEHKHLKKILNTFSLKQSKQKIYRRERKLHRTLSFSAGGLETNLVPKINSIWLVGERLRISVPNWACRDQQKADKTHKQRQWRWGWEGPGPHRCCSEDSSHWVEFMWTTDTARRQALTHLLLGGTC